MDLQTLLRVLRKRWKSVVIVALAILALVQLYTLLAPRKYQSSVQFFISTTDSTDVSQLAQGSNFSQARVTSYTQLVSAPIVLKPVMHDVGMTGQIDVLAKEVTATAPTNSVLIDVTVTDASAWHAQQIAKAIGTEFPKTVQRIERVSADSASPVKVTMTEPAVINRSAVSPRPLRNLALGLVLGLMGGVGVALLRNMMDSKVRTKEDIAELSDELTLIGSIAYDSTAAKQPLLVQDDPHSTRAESFRSLRTNLRFVEADRHPRTIVFTSSLAGEGKTTTTANLALIIAQTGASVCLVEGDLRRPRLLDYLGMEGGVGLTDVLIDDAELVDVLQPFGKHRLTLLGAGALPPNPSELLGSKAMHDLLDELNQRFDYVLIDAPPLLPVTDAAVLSTIADGAVLIVGSGLVTRDQALTAIESLHSANGRLLGVALNRVPHNRRTAGYYDYKYDNRKRAPADGLQDLAVSHAAAQRSTRLP